MTEQAFIRFNQAQLRKERRRELFLTLIFALGALALFEFAAWAIAEIELHTIL